MGSGCKKFLNTATLLVVFGLFTIGRSEYEVDHCYCYDEWREKQEEDTSLPSEPSPGGEASTIYHYNGVVQRESGDIGACECADIIRCQTVLIVMNSDIYTEAENILNHATLEELIREVINSLSTISNPNGNFYTHGTMVSFNERRTEPITTFNLELQAMGYATGPLCSDLTDPLADELLTDGIVQLPGIGEVVQPDFITLLCSSSPPDPHVDGTRIWNELNYAGVVATYECDSGYYIKGENPTYTCDHSELEWMGPDVTDLECSRGCQEFPSLGPISAVYDGWERETGTRAEGTIVKYKCEVTHESEDGDLAQTTCLNSEWTAIREGFKCTRILCPVNIPQGPPDSVHDFDKDAGEMVRSVNKKVYYTCRDGFRPNKEGDIGTICQTDGTWKPLPEGFECLKPLTLVELGLWALAKGQPTNEMYDNTYDYYIDGPQIENNSVQANYNLFLIVTLPTAGGLVIIIIIVLCCTRTDSCIFIVCDKRDKVIGYAQA